MSRAGHNEVVPAFLSSQLDLKEADKALRRQMTCALGGRDNGSFSGLTHDLGPNKLGQLLVVAQTPNLHRRDAQ